MREGRKLRCERGERCKGDEIQRDARSKRVEMCDRKEKWKS